MIRNWRHGYKWGSLVRERPGQILVALRQAVSAVRNEGAEKDRGTERNLEAWRGMGHSQRKNVKMTLDLKTDLLLLEFPNTTISQTLSGMILSRGQVWMDGNFTVAVVMSCLH